MSPLDHKDLTSRTHVVPIAGLQAIAGVATAVSIILTVGRLVIRWRNQRRFGSDDYLNAVAAILVIPFVVLCMLSLPIEYKAQLYYLGRIEESPSRDDLVFASTLEFPTLLLFWLIIYLVKGSFLSLYWHIFAVSTRFRILWGATVVYTALSFGVTWLSILWHCGTPSDVVDFDACTNMDGSIAINIVSIWCALNVLGGILLMVLPILMVTSRLLTLEKPQRYGLIFIFSLVMIDIAFDIVRTVYSLSNTLSVTTNFMAIWTVMEPTMAVIVCALPHYKSLVSRRKRNMSTSTASCPSFMKVDSRRTTAIPDELELASAYSLHSRDLGSSAA